MPRREVRRPSRSDNERYGCFNRIMDFFLIDFVLNVLFEIGCSSCLGLIVSVCLAAVLLAHGASHMIAHRPLALAWRPVRVF
ncbi:MAG: hypothetical protein JWQ02_1417 [Capsulimonas sp.]|jgi:hypothetical protein|nr:hypothetical protein [Capsulimonas sp.]